MTRFVLAACCVVLAHPAWAQRARIGGSQPDCPLQPATCEINVQVFDFGQGQMSQTAPPINGINTISVTCTRERLNRNLSVTVNYVLTAVPAAPARQMRNQQLHFLAYDMYVDPARTRYWGDGYTGGTFPFVGALFLDDRNRVGTLVHQLYGQVAGGQGATLPGQWLGLVGVQLQYTAVCAG